MDIRGEFRKRFLAQRGFNAPGAKNEIITSQQDRHTNASQGHSMNRVDKSYRMGDKPKLKKRKLLTNQNQEKQFWFNRIAERFA